MVGLLSYRSAASLLSQAVLLYRMAGIYRRLQVSSGTLGSASLRLDGQTPSNPVPLSCRARGYQAEMLFISTVKIRVMYDVDGLLWLFSVLIAEGCLLCGSPLTSGK